VRSARHPLDFGAAARHRVWSPPSRGPMSQNLWAPELHRIGGRHYIYFAADDGNNAHHRMWVLAAATSDPAGPYELAGMLDTGGWAIDGTTFTGAMGARFFLWSGWPADSDGQQNLYIAPMQNALRLAGPRVQIAAPEEPWARHGLPICEAPQLLRRHGRTFLVYSASGSWTEHYCLGLLELHSVNPLDPTAWEKHGCVFAKNRHAWGVGHCGFVTMDAGREDWILYHAKTSRRAGWADREVRAQRFTWDACGLPDFGRPGALPTTHTDAGKRAPLFSVTAPAPLET
jgi:GH43 family beta-xylosidase